MYICVLCLSKSSKEFYLITYGTPSIKDMLKTCCPDLDLSIFIEATVCHLCKERLDIFYKFLLAATDSYACLKWYIENTCPKKVNRVLLVSDIQYCNGTNKNDLFNYKCHGIKSYEDYKKMCDLYNPVYDKQSNFHIVIGYKNQDDKSNDVSSSVPIIDCIDIDDDNDEDDDENDDDITTNCIEEIVEEIKDLECAKDYMRQNNSIVNECVNSEHIDEYLHCKYLEEESNLNLTSTEDPVINSCQCETIDISDDEIDQITSSNIEFSEKCVNDYAGSTILDLNNAQNIVVKNEVQSPKSENKKPISFGVSNNFCSEYAKFLLNHNNQVRIPANIQEACQQYSTLSTTNEIRLRKRRIEKQKLMFQEFRNIPLRQHLIRRRIKLKRMNQLVRTKRHLERCFPYSHRRTTDLQISDDVRSSKSGASKYAETKMESLIVNKIENYAPTPDMSPLGSKTEDITSFKVKSETDVALYHEFFMHTPESELDLASYHIVKQSNDVNDTSPLIDLDDEDNMLIEVYDETNETPELISKPKRGRKRRLTEGDITKFHFEFLNDDKLIERKFIKSDVGSVARISTNCTQKRLEARIKTVCNRKLYIDIERMCDSEFYKYKLPKLEDDEEETDDDVDVDHLPFYSPISEELQSDIELDMQYPLNGIIDFELTDDTHLNSLSQIDDLQQILNKLEGFDLNDENNIIVEANDDDDNQKEQMLHENLFVDETTSFSNCSDPIVQTDNADALATRLEFFENYYLIYGDLQECFKHIYYRRKLKCGFCDKLCHDVQDHILDVHSNCSGCGFKIDLGNNLNKQRHLRECMHYTFVCDYCNVPFNKREEIELHQRLNAWIKILYGLVLKCVKCTLVFQDFCKFITHSCYDQEYCISKDTNTFDSTSDFLHSQCLICSDSIPTDYDSIIEHYYKHDVAAQYKCFECDQTFILDDFRQHILKTLTFVPCIICDQFVVRNIKVWLQHMQTHEIKELFVYACTICDRIFTTENKIIEHLHTHTKCEQCLHLFDTEALMNDHESAEVSETCTVCGNVAKSKCLANQHMYLAHGELQMAAELLSLDGTPDESIFERLTKDPRRPESWGQLIDCHKYEKTCWYQPKATRGLVQKHWTVVKCKCVLNVAKSAYATDASVDHVFCDMCCAVLPNDRLMALHKRLDSHDDKDLFRVTLNVSLDDQFSKSCCVCSQVFSTIMKLKRHKLIHVDDVNEFKCSICNHVYKSKYSFEKHISNHYELEHALRMPIDRKLYYMFYEHCYFKCIQYMKIDYLRRDSIKYLVRKFGAHTK